MALPWNPSESPSMWSLIVSGGFTMVPLLISSLLIWVVILERLWTNRNLKNKLVAFHLIASNFILKKDLAGLHNACTEHALLPTAHLILTAIETFEKKLNWVQSIEQKRQLVNQELKKNLWILGTIASSAPFIGLFGTVIGILRSFQSIAQAGGNSGFAIVAAGISESLVATACGIIVAVIAVVAFNCFQTWLSGIILLVRLQTEEMIELLESLKNEKKTASF